VGKVPGGGGEVSRLDFGVGGWYGAVVPGTVLTALVKDGVYPEPFYGEHNRPEVIPESLNKEDWWYRTEVMVPVEYRGRRVWLNLEGVNYAAEVWVNGVRVGELKGAFARGRFEVTSVVRAGARMVLAVRVSPQPHPGVPHEHTIKGGMGKNGGETAVDGPTFLATIGWDWLPAIRDRDTGIWQKVFLSSTGDVVVREPAVTTRLPLPRVDEADLTVKATVENVSEKPVVGVLRGEIEGVKFQRWVKLEGGESKVVSFGVEDVPELRLVRPRLWWPNGYGPCTNESGRQSQGSDVFPEESGRARRDTPSFRHEDGERMGHPGSSGACLSEMYSLRLEFVVGARVSDSAVVPFGVRAITYGVEGGNLALSVNGVKVFVRGGDWGMDEGMKRVPRTKLEAEIRMHALANLNLIRNWVGQSTSEDFYELCDKYGLLVWDEFFQPNPSDGPNPTDLETYMANARDKVLRFRNHPSIAVWCGRNEGKPPKEIDDALGDLMAELDPGRLYQPSSTDGKGVRSSGPYFWRTPREFYSWKPGEAFKTEIGSMSIPTLESVKGMMPAKDWETINDDWAEHDFAKGAQRGDTYKAVMEARYGKVLNLADFVRKGQMMNFEAYRAMFEGRQAKMFSGDEKTETTGVITWMSHPAQPSFVWQLYHYDLEPNASLFAVRSAAERVFALDGKLVSEKTVPVDVAASWVGEFGKVVVDEGVNFVELELVDGVGKVMSRNVYWRGDDLTAMDSMERVVLKVSDVTRLDVGGTTTVRLRLVNDTSRVAVMSHLQLRRSDGGRVLPVFYGENYLSLMPGEELPVSMAFDTKDLKGQNAVVMVDGWNVGVSSVAGRGVSVRENLEDEVEKWAVTGLPVVGVR